MWGSGAMAAGRFWRRVQPGASVHLGTVCLGPVAVCLSAGLPGCVLATGGAGRIWRGIFFAGLRRKAGALARGCAEL